jgi:hypothetical protein
VIQPHLAFYFLGSRDTFSFQTKKYLEDRWLIVVDCGFACLKTTAYLSHCRTKLFRGPLVNCCVVCLTEGDSKPFPLQNKKYLEDRWLIVVDCGFAGLKTTAYLSHCRTKNI